MKATLIITALFLTCVAAPAPDPGLTLSVNDPANAVWDVSRIPQLQHTAFDIQKRSGPGTEVEFDNPFIQTGAGKLKGQGTNLVLISYRKETNDAWTAIAPFAGTYTVNGSISSAKGKAVLTFGSSAKGAAFMEGKTRTLSAAAHYTVKILAPEGTLSGHMVTRASSSGYGTLTDQSTIEPQGIPDELGDGSWAIRLIYQTQGTKITGFGDVTLVTGTFYPFTITGSYNEKTFTAKLTLKGTDAAKNSLLQVTVANGVITRVSGLIAGQKVNVLSR